MTELEAIEKLRSLLSGQPAGPVDDDSDVEGFLVTCWPVLKGGDGGGMDVSKLVGRIESLAWEPPHLTFKIERHGGFVMGSGRAEMQSWAVNVNSGVARFGDGGYRQMRPRDPALKTRPIAEMVAREIQARSEPNYLRWKNPHDVRVLVGVLIPETSTGAKETLEGRRKRLRADLVEILAVSGWSSPSPNRFTRPDDGALPH